MIHFVPPHNEKIRAKIKDIAGKRRRRPRQPRGRHPRRPEGGGAQGLHRDGARHRFRLDRPVDAHQLPQQPVDARRRDRDRRRGRRQARRHHAAQGRGTLGHPLPRSAAGPARGQARRQEADPHPRHPGDGRGRQQRRGDRGRLPAHARHEPRPRRSRRLARHEDDARRRRPPRLRRAGGRGRRDGGQARRSTSRTCGTTPSARWSTPASPTA